TQAPAGRDQANLAVRIDYDEVEAVIELERHLWVVVGPMANEIAQARLSNERIVVDHELEVAYAPRPIRANEQRIDLKQCRLEGEELSDQSLSCANDCLAHWACDGGRQL